MDNDDSAERPLQSWLFPLSSPFPPLYHTNPNPTHNTLSTMADNNQTRPNGEEEEEEEKKIPVFTVLKNNAILKNIFLLDNPPSISVDKSDQETTGEEILTVRRLPNCTIMLTHPSISRFHLRIHSDPSSQKLSVIDLSSEHETWVSDNKIKPRFRVELNEGDTIQMGGSSRVYKRYWVPLSRAYDLENLFLSPSDMLMMEEKEEENVNSGGDNLEEAAVCEDDDSLSLKNKELQLLDSISEVMESFFPDENLEYFVKREVPSAPPMPEEDLAQKEDLIPSFEPNASEAVLFFVIVTTKSQSNTELKKILQDSKENVVESYVRSRMQPLETK